MTSSLVELLVHPAIYFLWRGRGLVEGPATAPGTTLDLAPEPIDPLTAAVAPLSLTGGSSSD